MVQYSDMFGYLMLSEGQWSNLSLFVSCFASNCQTPKLPQKRVTTSWGYAYMSHGMFPLCVFLTRRQATRLQKSKVLTIVLD